MLTQNEEHGAHYHSSRQDMLRALLVCCSGHSPELVCYWMCPEISKKERTNKNRQGSIAGTLGYFHFDWTNGIHIEVQDHDKKDNCGERHDERKPRLNLTLEMETDNTKHCQYSTGGEQISQSVCWSFVQKQILMTQYYSQHANMEESQSINTFPKYSPEY